MMNIKYFKILNFIAFILLFFYGYLIVHEVVHYFMVPEEYRGIIGSEAGGWRYQTIYHYLGSLYGELLLSLIGLLAGLFLKNAKRLFLLRASIVGFFLVQVLIFQLTEH